MKWMNWVLVLAVGVAMGLAATGCDSGDGDNPLVGTWNAESFNGRTLPPDIAYSFVFRSDGTVESSTTRGGVTAILDSGTWSAADGVLTLAGDDTRVTLAYAVTDDTLTLVSSEGTTILSRQ